VEFLEANWLRPHKSEITGEMIVRLRDVYQIPILATLAILGAETSLGDLTGMGGKLAEEACNYGGIKCHAIGPWSETATGRITIRGSDWWTWPDAQTGMDAWGKYLSLRNDGIYMRCLESDDFAALSGIYFGADVAGYDAYREDILKRVQNIRAKAAKAGYDW
jgi:hypothetical protein